ncbi:MAG: hypothetical protein JWN58_1987, partial [Gammaproteobacteria bacterium]|nr:hypothetical protein [Gammaproteobacteria bacterium]
MAPDGLSGSSAHPGCGKRPRSHAAESPFRRPGASMSGGEPADAGTPSATDPSLWTGAGAPGGRGELGHVDDGGRSLSDRVAQGARWMAISQGSTQVLRFATNIVLARILVPADFGVVAIGLTVTMFLEQFRDLGTGATVIQSKDVTHSMLSSIFYLNAIMGIALGLAVAAGASHLAVALGPHGGAHSQATQVLRAFAAIAVITSGSNIHHALLRRNMRFRTVGKIAIASALANTLVSIILAASGAGVWSIVGGVAAGNALGAAMAWALSGWRPGLSMRFRELEPIWKFAAFLFLTNILAFVLQQSDRVIVNRALGPAV